MITAQTAYNYRAPYTLTGYLTGYMPCEAYFIQTFDSVLRIVTVFTTLGPDLRVGISPHGASQPECLIID